MTRYRHTDCGGGWEQTEDGNLRCVRCGTTQKVVTSAQGVRAVVEPVIASSTFAPDQNAVALDKVRALIALYKSRKAGLIAINELERAIGDRE